MSFTTTRLLRSLLGVSYLSVTRTTPFRRSIHYSSSTGTKSYRRDPWLSYTQQNQQVSQVGTTANTNTGHTISSFLIQELETAKIGFSDIGKIYLQNAFASLSPTEYNPQNIVDRNTFTLTEYLEEEFYNRPDDPLYDYLYENSLSRDNNGPKRKHLWRSEQTKKICIDYRIYMMWEAVYYRSRALRPLLKEEEEYCGNKDDLTATGFWMILDQLYYWAVVNREDVEKLPDPIEYTYISRE